MRAKLKQSLDEIVDCITCSDGGVHYMLFRHMLDIVDTQAAAGDAAAEEILQVVHRFARLIDVSHDPATYDKSLSRAEKAR